jgi:hypothetical protein
MPMTLEPNGLGGLRIRQVMSHPVVYLDHWAVRRFGDDVPLADRFIAALHAAKGTWLFSQANLQEFIAMHDIATARRVEALIARAFPYFHVLDTISDTDFFRRRQRDQPRPPDAPQEHWILGDLMQRALITNGQFNTRNFISDQIERVDVLRPQLEQMKQAVANHVNGLRAQIFSIHERRKLVPRPGMRLAQIFMEELLIEPAGNAGHAFTGNDALDFVHALPACQICDLVLLDSDWRNKMEVSTRRIRKAGIKGQIATCYSSKTLPDFLTALEAAKK